MAALSVLHAEIDDIFGGAVAFDDATSVKARLGMWLGHDFTLGNNTATISAVGFPATEVADESRCCRRQCRVALCMVSDI